MYSFFVDSALINEYQEISNYMKSRNASTFFSIGKSAAILIQARFRGFRIRKSFNEHKTLLVKYVSYTVRTLQQCVYVHIRIKYALFSSIDTRRCELKNWPGTPQS